MIGIDNFEWSHIHQPCRSCQATHHHRLAVSPLLTPVQPGSAWQRLSAPVSTCQPVSLATWQPATWRPGDLGALWHLALRSPLQFPATALPLSGHLFPVSHLISRDLEGEKGSGRQGTYARGTGNGNACRCFRIAWSKCRSSHISSSAILRTREPQCLTLDMWRN